LSRKEREKGEREGGEREREREREREKWFFSGSKLNFPELSSSSFGINLKDYFVTLVTFITSRFSPSPMLKGYELAKDDSLHGNILEEKCHIVIRNRYLMIRFHYIFSL